MRAASQPRSAKIWNLPWGRLGRPTSGGAIGSGTSSPGPACNLDGRGRQLLYASPLIPPLWCESARVVNVKCPTFSLVRGSVVPL